MSFVALYPIGASSSEARFRIIALGNAQAIALETLLGQAIALQWQSTSLDNGEVVLESTAVISALPADSEITVRVLESGQELQKATVRTLPADLTAPGSELRIVLASCYCRLNDSSRLADQLFQNLFRAYGTPHLKIWCGDQVYLDSPATHFLKEWKLSSAEIADSHLNHYVSTWSAE